MKENWHKGNSISLLENGDELFPRMIQIIDQAHHEILLETFIWFDDPVGQKIKQALIDAALRGVWVSVLVDGYGSHFLPRSFIEQLTEAGVRFYVHDPQATWFRVRLNIFKRMHRKLLVVDGRTAFVGGINLAHNQISDYGVNFKQDYAVELQGPVVEDIRRFLHTSAQEYATDKLEFVELPEVSRSGKNAGEVEIRFVTRDNKRHRTAIERQFLRKMRKAKSHITIANPYFFPGYRMLRELRRAARRGVKVRLLVQGKLGSPLAKRAARALYDFLVESGVEVYEYWERQLHGKIAAIDGDWSTVGSSNLDPLSLSLNLEANVVVLDPGFNQLVTQRILELMGEHRTRQINASWIHRRTLVKWFGSFLAFHFLRHFPRLADWLPPSEPDGNTSVGPDSKRKNKILER